MHRAPTQIPKRLLNIYSSILLLTLLGLTPAEASVARALADGHRPQDIADARTVSVTTIRAQVRAIYAKLEVRSVAGLAGKLRGLG